MKMRQTVSYGAVALVTVLATASGAAAQGNALSGSDGHAGPAPIRVTMDQLHAQGGVPRGWKFLLPAGDPVQGKKVFSVLECFACHDVSGSDFPQPTKTTRGAGPELTGMGSHHPVEYFAESIMNPNRVIVLGTGFTSADGLSKMPDYSETLTVRQLIDLVAYLKSLTGGAMAHGAQMHGSGEMKMR